MGERNKIDAEEQLNVLQLVPQSFLESMADTQRKILERLEHIKPVENLVGDYISEGQAKKLLNKKTTWFWNKRKSGELAFTKVGNTIYYSKTDIQKLFDKYKIASNSTL